MIKAHPSDELTKEEFDKFAMTFFDVFKGKPMTEPLACCQTLLCGVIKMCSTDKEVRLLLAKHTYEAMVERINSDEEINDERH